LIVENNIVEFHLTNEAFFETANGIFNLGLNFSGFNFAKKGVVDVCEFYDPCGEYGL
jgi:hypothetical protein